MAKSKLRSPDKQKQPNFLVIFGDDIGYWNVGIYSHGSQFEDWIAAGYQLEIYKD